MLESRKYQQAKVKTVRRLTVISALVFVLLLGILAYFISSKLDVINSNYTAVRSLSETKNLKDRLGLAVSAWSQNNGVLPKKALIAVFNDILYSESNDTSIIIDKNRYKIVFEEAPGEIIYAACSKDNKYIYGYCDSLIVIWEITGKLYRTLKLQHQLIDLKISDNSHYLGAVSSDSLLTIFDILGNTIFTHKVYYNSINTKQIFRFTFEDKILTLSSNHDAVLLNNDGTLIQSFDRHADKVNAIDITGKGKFIATASSDKTIVIWYMDPEKKVYEYYNTLNWHTDTVWSVSFSEINGALLSASADSSIKVGSVNNEVLSYDDFFPIDKKYCFAEFTPSARGIEAISYENNFKEHDNLFLGSHADNPTCSQYGFNKRMIHGSEGIELSDLVFSPEEKYLIYRQKGKSYLADNRVVFAQDNTSIYNLMEITGSKQFFTSDEKYILAICGKNLKSYFIDIDEISILFNNINRVTP